MSNIKKLTEDKNSLITRAEEIINTAENEKRDISVSELTEMNQIRSQVDGINEQIKAIRTAEELGKDGAEEKAAEETKETKEETDMDKATEAAEARAFEAHIRGILNERDDNTPLSKTANGAIVPVTIANRIIRKLYEICPIAERATKYDVRGTLSIPYYGEDATDKINVAFQGAEFTKLSANSGKFTSITLSDYVAGALALVSRQLINNTEFDLVGYVVDQMAYSIRRFLENTLLNGSGPITGQTGTVAGLTGVTQTVNAAASNVITGDELIKLQDSVKDLFQDGAIWIMSPATRTAIRQLKSNTGYYLLQQDINAPFGNTLLGKPVYVSDNMPDMEAGKAAIYYGNMNGLALKFSQNLEIQVLREKYADQNADGVIGWFSFDAKVQDAQQISKLVMGGSPAPESPVES